MEKRGVQVAQGCCGGRGQGGKKQGDFRPVAQGGLELIESSPRVENWFKEGKGGDRPGSHKSRSEKSDAKPHPGGPKTWYKTSPRDLSKIIGDRFFKSCLLMQKPGGGYRTSGRGG